MAKIQNDKYYTSPELAKYCVDKTKEIIGEDNIVEYVEPSAGSGVFLDYLDKPYLAYDIEPEDSRVTKADWLEVNLDYKKGRCIIGNPPFGNRNTLIVKFYKQAIQFCDYISFILPLSQLDNSNQLYHFDLIHSEDLGVQNYSGRKLHCCLNIYKRPTDGINEKKTYKLKCLKIEENRRTGHQINDNKDFDIGLCTFGTGIIGRIPEYVGQYAKEMYFKICDDTHREEILKILKTTDWEREVCNGTSGQQNLTQWQVCKYLKEQIPELE